MTNESAKKSEPPLEVALDNWKPAYLYSVGELSPFFRSIINDKKLLASKCPHCGKVFMPARGDCPDCYEDVVWVPLSGEGTVISCSYVYFKGHGTELLGYLDLPYVYALIHLDGTDTYLSHGVKPKTQKMGEIVKDTRVKVVFREERKGTIGDFYFVPIG